MIKFTEALAAIEEAEFLAKLSGKPMAVCSINGYLVVKSKETAETQKMNILEVVR